MEAASFFAVVRFFCATSNINSVNSSTPSIDFEEHSMYAFARLALMRISFAKSLVRNICGHVSSSMQSMHVLSSLQPARMNGMPGHCASSSGNHFFVTFSSDAGSVRSKHTTIASQCS